MKATKEHTIDNVKECVNCGDLFENGDGYPEGKGECCCSIECYIEFSM